MATSDRILVRESRHLEGEVRLPGDKSISHRAVLLGALAPGTSRVTGWLDSADTQKTLACMEALGIGVDHPATGTLHIHGGKLVAPKQTLEIGNSATGMRLLTGILSGQNFTSVVDGSIQLQKRPMQRLLEPLSLMGALIESRGGYAPLRISPARLHGIEYRLPIATAQVKSAILLAGLWADGASTIIQPGPARDHTERMLQAMGANISMADNRVTLTPGTCLCPFDLEIPGDFSSAAFLLAAAILVPESKLKLVGVELNPTRTGFLDVLTAMGAAIHVEETGTVGGEPVGNIEVCHSSLAGVDISGDTVVRMIDEFPLLMLLALAAQGKTMVRNAAELRVKETDRLATMTTELRKLGAVLQEQSDGFVVEGPQQLSGAKVDSHGDHRIGMTLAVAGLIASGETMVEDFACSAGSFPGFAECLAGLGAVIRDS